MHTKQNKPQQKKVFIIFSRSETRSTTKSIPRLRFEDHRLSSFSGIIILQRLFQDIKLKEQLKRCFSHQGLSSSYGLHNIAFLLILHMLIGWRRLSDVQYYKEDPMILRTLGLKRLPHVSAISRSMKNMDECGVNIVSGLARKLVVDRLHEERFKTLTFDFDGSVISTKSRGTEGTAVDFNKKKKGSRSYYPILATVAQAGQVYSLRNRPGNVHDSNGAKQFIEEILNDARSEFPNSRLESRLDSAHFNENTCFWLDTITEEDLKK